MTMTLLRIPIVASAALALASQVSSFTPVTPCNIRTTIPSSSSLYSFIKGEAVSATPFDENEGGVGLAKRSAIKITGVSATEKGSTAQDLVRYERMQEIEKSSVISVMEKSECYLVCSGSGKELYQDPGKSGDVDGKVIKLAPIEAAKNALSSMASAVAVSEEQTVMMNFLGGDELIIGEVLEACDLLVGGLDLPAKTKVKFNSISFDEIAEDVCSVVVVAAGGKAAGMDGVEESVAMGELYVRDGKWTTVAEGDITTATN
mmetsp:Transcript_3802/g.7373  ORF Transcript_3802/g.7373 Transcript_3802/m.7373 type:complete len:261 (-) Transcript_3802:427-1209(-)|eukprot:CAMPEP_0201671820 /NCGR_PEP_ID=MMETSP0494-20130426/30761_1 /ASSEMBLY_ACC=CAM_ASM_000839 /TAXON_ID=420259 /ORGANISM="Thalassiosira gravida, Strain GMp14c1" /LENGTH=260 /DNA_ID=CAMNT_0048153287 /DNA_START=1 /DNA_END=783 /DNA_ORIENTATION=+